MSMNTQSAKTNSSKRKGKGRWWKTLAQYALVLIVVSAAMDWWHSRHMPQQVAPPLETQSLTGQTVDVIKMSQQQPVVLYFWATWCGACRLVTPTVNWLSEFYPVVTVALSSGSGERVQQYLKHHNYPLSTLNDPKGALAKEWGVRVTPTIVILHKGEIRRITTGITTPVGLLVRLWSA